MGKMHNVLAVVDEAALPLCTRTTFPIHASWSRRCTCLFSHVCGHAVEACLTHLPLILPEYPLDLADHPVDGLGEPPADAHVGLRVERERRRRRGRLQQPLHGDLRRRPLQRPHGPPVPGRIGAVILRAHTDK